MIIAIDYRRYYIPEVFGCVSYDEMPPMPAPQKLKELRLVGKVPYSSAWAGADGAEWDSGNFDVFADETGALFTLKEECVDTPPEGWLNGWPAYACYRTVAMPYVDKEVGERNSCKNPRYWHGVMQPV